MEKYHTGAHSKHLLKAHIIFCVHYRLKIVNRYIDTIKQVMVDVANNYEFKIEVMEADKDHIHLLIDYPPKLSISKIVQALKSISTRELWKQHADSIDKNIWGNGRFWSDGYFAASTGDVSTDTIRKYIENQG